MIVAVPKEVKEQEYRAALPPSAAYQLIKRGHRVLVETGAGAGAGYPDGDYEQAGATIVREHAVLFEQGELIVKVKEPGLAYETIEVSRRLPLLEPMSEIAGRMSILVGGYFLAKHFGGSGTLLGGVPGVLPGRVVVLGGGVSGINAARMATGVGADVTVLEVDLERMRFLDITLHTAHTLYSNEAHLMELLPAVDLLVGAVLVPGAKAPKLIRREMLRRMRPGSVLVDIAIDQGGCAESSRPTTHHDPVFAEEGVTHYCVANMPAAYARTATQALTNVTYPYIELLADCGLAEACQRQPHLLGGINVLNGKLTCKAVAEAHGMAWQPPLPT